MPPSSYSPERDWILIGMAERCAQVGYEATTTESICAVSGVSRETFERSFAGRDECLGATMELIVDAGRRRLEAACPAGPWEERLTRGVAAMLGFLAERPAFAHTALIEAAPAGGRAALLYGSAKAALLAEIERGPDRTGAGIPAAAGRGALAGVETLLASRVVAGKAAELRDLTGEVIYSLAVPHLGRGEAQRLAARAVQRRPALRAVA